jgi:hypothetical protein
MAEMIVGEDISLRAAVRSLMRILTLLSFSFLLKAHLRAAAFDWHSPKLGGSFDHHLF